MRKISLLFAFILWLTGCSHLAEGNRVSVPSGNKNMAPLKAPPGMEISFDTLYPIPVRNYASTVKPVDIIPPSLNANQNVGKGWFSWY